MPWSEHDLESTHLLLHQTGSAFTCLSLKILLSCMTLVFKIYVFFVVVCLFRASFLHIIHLFYLGRKKLKWRNGDSSDAIYLMFTLEPNRTLSLLYHHIILPQGTLSQSWWNPRNILLRLINTPRFINFLHN